jgi:hypothetical protein
MGFSEFRRNFAELSLVCRVDILHQGSEFQDVALRTASERANSFSLVIRKRAERMMLLAFDLWIYPASELLHRAAVSDCGKP